jgi:hypothetical protein
MAEHETSNRSTLGEEYRPADDARHERRRDEVPRERRSGPSALATWSGRRLALSCLAWLAILATLLVIGAVMSVVIGHGTEELRTDMTRANLTGLLAVATIPPACLTFQWWRMHGRRRRHGEAGRR